MSTNSKSITESRLNYIDPTGRVFCELKYQYWTLNFIEKSLKPSVNKGVSKLLNLISNCEFE